MKFHSFIKFIFLSGCGWLLDVIILLTLNQIFLVPLFYANFISSLCAASMVFWLSRKKIHDGYNDNSYKRLIIYIAYTIALISIFSMIMPIVANELKLFFNQNGAASLLAKIICTPPQLLANYFASRLIARFNTQNRAIG